MPSGRSHAWRVPPVEYDEDDEDTYNEDDFFPVPDPLDPDDEDEDDELLEVTVGDGRLLAPTFGLVTMVMQPLKTDSPLVCPCCMAALVIFDRKLLCGRCGVYAREVYGEETATTTD